MPPFSFRLAVRENTAIVMALAGASGSGKTFTALELATGLAGDGKIAVIDTEGRRALHYADLMDVAGQIRFRFDHGELRPPFSPANFLAALQSAESAGYRAIVIDSFSDEHEGAGGLIDMAAAGTNPNLAANWAKPKAEHKKIIRWLRQTRAHVIFCMRAEERVKFEKAINPKTEREETVIVPLGWMPICEKRFMYDMTASFLMTPDRPGIPQPIKLQEQHRRFFPEGQLVTRDSGRLLAEWAAGGAPPAMQQSPPSLAEEATEVAENGMAALEAFWGNLPRHQRRALLPNMDEIKARAAAADVYTALGGPRQRTASGPAEPQERGEAAEASKPQPAASLTQAATARNGEPHSTEHNPRPAAAATDRPGPASPQDASPLARPGQGATSPRGAVEAPSPSSPSTASAADSGAASQPSMLPPDEQGQLRPRSDWYDRPSLLIEPRVINGAPDWATWLGAQFLPRVRGAVNTRDLAFLLGENEANIALCKAAIPVEAADLDADIKAQWERIE